MEKQWITVTQAAELVDRKRTVIHYHIPRCHFEVKRVGSIWLIDRESLLEWFNK